MIKRHTPLVALLLVNAIACIGTRVSAIAIPWFVLITTGSATQTGLVAACELAPYVIVKALAGPITDRLGQRRVSIAADLASMIIIGLIPIALRGLTVRAAPAAVVLRRNLVKFGLGGLLLPFPFIKLIDWLITTTGLVS